MTPTRAGATLPAVQLLMSDLVSNAQRVFAAAADMPPGEARAKLVARLSGDETALLREVESLLQAHDNAGGFVALRPPSPRARAELPSTTAQGTVRVNPAAHAEAFLRGCSNPTVEQVEAFVAQLPEAMRQEARERIEALQEQVKELKAEAKRPPNTPTSHRACRVSLSNANLAREDWAWCMPRMTKS